MPNDITTFGPNYEPNRFVQVPTKFLLAVLEPLEWSGTVLHGGLSDPVPVPACPECDEFQSSKKHASTCRLGLLLGQLRERQ